MAQAITLVDSHCHLTMLDASAFENGLDTVMENAKANQVNHLLTVSVDLKTFPDVLAVAKQYSNVSCSVGVHPHNDEEERVTSEELITLAKDEKVVAIGETGLDFYYNNEKADLQKKHFIEHINAAKTIQKPLIIHTRAAQEDTLSIMRNEHAEDAGGVLHCFTESWEMAKQALDMGFYISISGIVTFKKAQQVQEVAKQVPLERLLIETDSPYLAPAPRRGKPNQPAWVRHVAEFIAQLRGISLEALAQATTNNYFQLFKGAK